MAKRKPFAPPFEVRAFGPATLVRGDCREVLAWYSSGIDQGQLEPADAYGAEAPGDNTPPIPSRTALK